MMRQLLERAMNLLFPTRAVCLNCGDPAGLEHDWLCEKCRAALKPRLHTARSPEWPEDGISRAWFSLYYERPASRLIRQFKYQGVYRLVPFFAECLEPVIEGISPDDYNCIVPVPLFDVRRRDRGFNQAELLARTISDRTGIPLSGGVSRTRNTRQQARLSIQKRRQNLRGAFIASQSFEGMRVLVVDDVLTTGSTVNSCARALREAGAVDVQAVTLAGSRYYRHHRAEVYRKRAPKSKKIR